MVDEPPIEATPANFDKINDILEAVFDIIYGSELNLLEMEIIANSIWTKVTTNKLTQISIQQIAVHQDLNQEEHKVNNSRPSYYG